MVSAGECCVFPLDWVISPSRIESGMIRKNEFMVRVLLFGRLAEITGNRSMNMQAADTAELMKMLSERHPELNGHSIAVAVNKRLTKDTVILNAGDEVALMPPYSGG